MKSSVGPYSAAWTVWAGTVKGVNPLSDLNPLHSLSSGEWMQEEQKESAYWDYFLILRTAHKVVISSGILEKNSYIYSSEFCHLNQSYLLNCCHMLHQDICQQNLKSKQAGIKGT